MTQLRSIQNRRGKKALLFFVIPILPVLYPLEWQFSCHCLIPHFEVPHEAVKGILESGRLVLFKEEVADPSKAVAAEEGVEKGHWVQSDHKSDDVQNDQTGPYNQRTAYR